MDNSVLKNFNVWYKLATESQPFLSLPSGSSFLWKKSEWFKKKRIITICKEKVFIWYCPYHYKIPHKIWSILWLLFQQRSGFPWSLKSFEKSLNFFNVIQGIETPWKWQKVLEKFWNFFTWKYLPASVIT